MKPDWKDAPEWAMWLAMDGDGWWGWYEEEPAWDCEADIWAMHEDSEADWEVAGDTPDCDGIDWDHAFSTLEPRP